MLEGAIWSSLFWALKDGGVVLQCGHEGPEGEGWWKGCHCWWTKVAIVDGIVGGTLFRYVCVGKTARQNGC